MLKNDSDSTWEHYGSHDPYYGVLTCDKYKTPNFDTSTRIEFFESGVTHITTAANTIKRHIDSNFSPKTALDFGCGVGRLLIPRARIANHVVGLDVSNSYLAECRKNCKINSITNFELYKSDDSLSSISGKYDLIHSHMVFQHISVKRVKLFLPNSLII